MHLSQIFNVFFRYADAKLYQFDLAPIWLFKPCRINLYYSFCFSCIRFIHCYSLVNRVSIYYCESLVVSQGYEIPDLLCINPINAHEPSEQQFGMNIKVSSLQHLSSFLLVLLSTSPQGSSIAITNLQIFLKSLRSRKVALSFFQQ